MSNKKWVLQNRYLQQAEADLRNAGVRVTSARIQVLATLLNAGSTLLHQELLALLPTMDRVTLYRSLDTLIDAGLAHKIAVNDRAFRYSAGADHEHSLTADHQHGHFKCTGCGKVFCLTPTPKKRTMLDQLHKSLQQTVGAGFQSHDIELTIKGWCADCAR